MTKLSLLKTIFAFLIVVAMVGCGEDNTPAVNSAPEFEQEAYTFEIAENASSGDALGAVSATDENASDILAYSITTTQTDFAMNASTGEVALAADAVLDYEAVVSYTLQVQVSDGATPALTATAEITINVGDVNESSPEFAFADNATSYSFSLAADAADGDEVGKIAATDADGTAMLTYTLSGEEAGNFAITDGTNVASGEEVTVTVAANADLTSLVSPVKIAVTVSDGENPVDAEVEIVITSVGTGTNAAPVFANTSYSFNVASDAADEAVVGTVSATDEDEGAMLTYSLSGTDAGSFAISNTAVASGTEVSVTVATNADLPSLTSPVAIMAEASDGVSTATANVEITITVGNVAPVFDQTAYTFTTASDAADDAVVGTVSAVDSNAGDLLTYSLSGTGAGHFEIKNGTAVAPGVAVSVIVATNADLSSLTSPVALTVEVSDGTLTAVAAVEITIATGNVAPVFDQTAYTFNVAEGAVSGAVLGPVSATDSNAGDLLTYSLSGTDADHFSINNTPVASGTAVPITVAAGANLPSLGGAVTLTATVTDDQTPALTHDAAVEITITAGNVAPVFDQTAYTFSVDEDAASSEVVDVVSATDSNAGDLLIYTISGEGADNFAIDNTAVASGTPVQITVSSTASLDHETTTSYTLEVQASDDATPALTATAEVTINVNDVNDNDPVFTGAPYTFSVDENSPASTVVDVVAATDADAGTTLAYRITTTPTDFDLDANTGEMTVGTSATLDFETTASYTLEVEASDGTNAATAEVTINVNDVNDNDPVFAQASYIFNVDENSPVDTEVGMVVATDADAGTTLAYRITTTQTNFDINANGEMTVGTSAALDFETTTSYMLEVEASDGTNTATAEVTINVDDVNDNGPVFTGAPYTFNVNENSAVNTMVGTVVATDIDANTTLEYSIVGTQTDFDIDTGTGEIKVASATLDHEVMTSYTLEVQASDGASPPLTATAEVTINVNDLNDETPVFGEMAYTFEVVGVNAESGDEVGTVAATDADAGATLQYSITNTQTEFDIDANTGIITVSDAATLSTATPSYTLMVQVDDGTNTAMANVTINIVGVDYDVDGDGLIDINNLEQLNAMRWDLDGDGMPAAANTADYDAAFPDAVAFATTPTGYELIRSLDFDEDDSYAGLEADQTWSEAQGTTSGGWDPIGNFTSETNFTPYTAVFDGNNYTLSNLYIARSDDTGLFASLSATSTVSNVGLLDVDILLGRYIGSLVAYSSGGTITGCHATGSVSGAKNIGGLVGWQNGGSITACYAMVAVAGAAPNTGGLVGQSSANSTITACYATGNGNSSDAVLGGLVGRSAGTVTACYATGNVDAFNEIGGLVGINSGTITACYSTGDVAGFTQRGGLVYSNSGTVTASYFDFTVNSDLTEGSEGKTTSELQTPTVYDDDTDATNSSSIYETWNLDLDNADTDDDLATGMDDPWDFGTSDQYPVLKIDFNNDGSTADDVTRQRQ